MNHQTLIDAFGRGEIRALSRLISLAENKDDAVIASLASIFERTGRASVVGITGPPGAGKSTLVNAFVRFCREEKKTVAVLAVDPVSPFTGGSLLGDRIRLTDHFNDPGVFIRSLSTRGRLGGLSLATREVAHLCDAFGFDYVLIETVGVGQSEVEIRRIADLTLVVLVPEWGDAIQTLKAGVLEIGDVFSVNKADREGAERLALELKGMLKMAKRDSTPVLSTSHQDGASVRGLFETIREILRDGRPWIEERRAVQRGETAMELLEAVVVAEARRWASRQQAAASNPYAFIQSFLKHHPPGSLLKP